MDNEKHTMEMTPQTSRQRLMAALVLPGAAGVTGTLMAGEFKAGAITAALFVGAIGIVSALLMSAWFHGAIEAARAEARNPAKDVP
jgi:hypothetical protein